MIRLLAAELLKVVTTRALLWIGLLVLGLATLVESVHIASTPDYHLATADEQRSLFTFVAIGTLFAIVLGIMVAAGEYSHETIGYTFLAAPARERVLAAKLVAAALLGFGLGVFTEAVTVAIAAVWFAGEGLHLGLGHRDVLAVLGGSLVAAALGGAIGVGIGGMFRRQQPAIVLTLLWLLIAENALNAAGSGARFGPGHAFGAVAVARGGDLLLHFWPGLAVAGLYTALFAVVGGAAMRQADVS